MLFREYTCNKCGKKFNDYDCMSNPFLVSYRFGYGVERDGRLLSYFLCKDCLEEFIESTNDWEVEILSED